MDSLNIEQLLCPVCHEIFKRPVLLSCCHNICNECLQLSRKPMEPLECPVCRRRPSENPSCNFALKSLCESFLKERNERRSAGSEEICRTHGEELKLLCLEDIQPACSVCRDTQKHDNQTFRPLRKDLPAYKMELNTALKTLQEKLKHGENLKREFEETVQHIKSQAEHTEHQIKQQFKKLHQFLRDEEASTITALREEEEQKKKMMNKKLKEMNTHISALFNIIKDMEKMIKADDVSFLKKFPVMMERVKLSSQLDPQMPSGGLIYVPRYLGNLPYKVSKKMLNSVQKKTVSVVKTMIITGNQVSPTKQARGDSGKEPKPETLTPAPMTLDPNTAHPCLVLSDDLTIARFIWDKKTLPDNPERFDICGCVLGSEGFNFGMHFWEVEVKESEGWSVGVTTESNQRKGRGFFETDVWCVKYDPYRQFGPGFPVKQELEYVRVDLDYDGGRVSFSDPVTDTHLHTFTTIFTEVVFPFFCNLDELNYLRILPVKL